MEHALKKYNFFTADFKKETELSDRMLLKEVMVQNARNLLHIFASTEKKIVFL